MRIALLSCESLHSIAVGGVAVHVTELAAAFDRRGHEVLTPAARSLRPRDKLKPHGTHDLYFQLI